MAKQGGKRKGAGRKPLRGVAKITTSIDVTPELKSYLASRDESQSEFVETAIRRTKSFRDWSLALKYGENRVDGR